MTLILNIPVPDVKNVLGGDLTLAYPVRCSRCGSLPAEQFDTRPLRMLARPKRGNFNRTHYEFNKPYTLKIRVCHDCRQADYLTNPEALKYDQSPLGSAARIQSAGFTIGGVIAALGILFNTPFIPASGFLAVLKTNWMYIAAAGLFIIILIWLYQLLTQKKVRAELTDRGYDPNVYSRAEVRTPVIADENDSTAVPLEIGINDDSWGQECAENYHWNFRSNPD